MLQPQFDIVHTKFNFQIHCLQITPDFFEIFCFSYLCSAKPLVSVTWRLSTHMNGFLMSSWLEVWSMYLLACYSYIDITTMLLPMLWGLHNYVYVWALNVVEHSLGGACNWVKFHHGQVHKVHHCLLVVKLN